MGVGLTSRVHVLGIEVCPDLLAAWSGWFAPPVQPFLVVDGPAAGATRPERLLSAEVRDTFQIYDIPDGFRCVWLSESDFAELPTSSRLALVRARGAAERLLAPSVRSWSALRGRVRGQVDGHRFLWWPPLLVGHEEQVLARYVEDGRRPSCHQDIGERTWQRAGRMLPGARALAGTFPSGSGPNCFGTVMAAAGVTGAESVWMQREPFEAWLSATTRAGGLDDDVGTVLVWRSVDGLAQHAAVTIGGGWALHKPSQGWMSPTKVLTVADVKRSAHGVGRRLRRHTIGR